MKYLGKLIDREAIKYELFRRETKPIDAVLKVIIGEKCFKAVVLLLLSISIFPVLSEETKEFLHYLANRSYILSNAHIVTSFFIRFDRASGMRLLVYSIFFLLWGVLELTEGIGLAKRRRWAEYLAVIGTGIFIPVELLALINRFTYEKVSILFFNIFLVIYLIWSRKLFSIQHDTI